MEQVRLLLAEHATLDEGFIQGVAGFLVGIAVRAPGGYRYRRDIERSLPARADV
jgi:hypothetical protein